MITETYATIVAASVCAAMLIIAISLYIRGLLAQLDDVNKRIDFLLSRTYKLEQMLDRIEEAQ